MKLRQLFEAKQPGNEVAIIFGRFNPPHKGHRAAWELASKSPKWYVGTNQSTVGPKDPLPFDVKVEAMKTIWPEVEGHIVAETSWLTLASKVYQENPDATLLCLTDEDWVTKTIVQYNGKEGPHGFYNFKNIQQKPTPRLSSATALRDAVTKGDREAFAQAAGVPADVKVAGAPFFDLVAKYLLPYANAPKKAPAKKKAAEPVSAETIEKHGSQYRLVSKHGHKNLGTYPTKAGAEKRERQVQYFKHHEDVQEADKHSFVGKIQRGNELKKKVDSTWKDIGDAQKAGDKEAGSRAFRKHERYANLERPGTWTKADESGSKAMAQTASRLTDPKDGKVAKLRAAGDKRREDDLKYRDIAKRNEAFDLKTSLQELSNDMLGNYKKAASDDASKADKAGDFKRGNKRFSGIVKATNKQFANDMKKHKK